MTSQDFKIVGLDELQQRLDEFPEKIQRNVLRGALRAAMILVRDDAKARVPVLTGTLRDSIRVSIRTAGGNVVATLKAGGRVNNGSQKGKQGADRGAFYAHMVEFGTAAHFIRAAKNMVIKIGSGLFTKVVAHPGAQAKPFMRPAIAAQSGAAADRFADYMSTRLDKLDQVDND